VVDVDDTTLLLLQMYLTKQSTKFFLDVGRYLYRDLAD